MTAKARRFGALDAWRGIAALVVALLHLPSSSPLHDNRLVAQGGRFVDFFFVLSGFVIAHAYRDRLRRCASEIAAFMTRRIGRLWPVHVLMLGMFLASQLMVWVAAHLEVPIGSGAAFARFDFSELPANLGLVHAWGMYRLPTWNAVSWSISTELFAYGAFALLCVLARGAAYVIALLLTLAASLAVVLFVAPDGMESMADYGVFRCLYGFMAGGIVRALWGAYPRTFGAAGELVAVVAIVVAITFLPAGACAALVVPVFAAGVFVFAAEAGPISRALMTDWPQQLGRWSYSIYMLHFFIATCVLAVLKQKVALVDGKYMLVGDPVWASALTVPYVLLVVALAAVLHRVVELPGQRRFNRWADAQFKRR